MISLALKALLHICLQSRKKLTIINGVVNKKSLGSRGVEHDRIGAGVLTNSAFLNSAADVTNTNIEMMGRFHLD